MRQKYNDLSSIYAHVDYQDPYVQPLVVQALRSVLGDRLTILEGREDESLAQLLARHGLPQGSSILQIRQYESLDWEYAHGHQQTCLLNSYMIRKALIRKNYLWASVEAWVAKRGAGGCSLSQHVPRSEVFELDYAEFLDDALVECWDLRASLAANADLGPSERQWWMLKPAMSDGGTRSAFAARLARRSQHSTRASSKNSA